MADNGTVRELLVRKWADGQPWKTFLLNSEKNVDEMRNLYAETEVPEDIVEIMSQSETPVHLVVLGADWCGDFVRNAPAVSRLCDLNPNVQFRVFDRDTHDDLMQHFLTNGGKAIPKIIIGDPEMTSFHVWGPRPAECQAIMDTNRDKMPKEQIYPMIREWYEKDCCQSVIREVFDGMRKVMNT